MGVIVIVTASVTEELKRDVAARAKRKDEGQEEETALKARQTAPNRSFTEQPEPAQAGLPGPSQKDVTQDDVKERDSGTAVDGRAALTGKLCRRVMALIRWQSGVDTAVDDRMVRALEAWLRRRGISIYTDQV
jgi:hypothetical protein